MGQGAMQGVDWKKKVRRFEDCTVLETVYIYFRSNPFLACFLEEMVPVFR